MKTVYYLLAAYASLALYMAIEEHIYRNIAGKKYRPMIGSNVLIILVSVGVIANLAEIIQVITTRSNPALMPLLISLAVLLICLVLFLVFAIDRWRKLDKS